MLRRAWLAAACAIAAKPALAQEITVRGAPESRAPSAVALSGARASEGAGTQGDPLKALQTLPGSGRGGAGGELVLWGALPSESRVEVDGVEIPALYHGSAVRSVLPAGSVASVTSVPGAYGVEHGRALGGLVLVDTVPADLERARFRASADVLDGSAQGSMPLGAHGAVGAGVRYGYVDRWLPRLLAPELLGLYRIPSYWDSHAELFRSLGAGQTLRVRWLSSSDQRQTELSSSDPALRTTAREAQSFGRLYLQYRTPRASITPFVGWDAQNEGLRVGRERADLDTRALRYGIRALYRERLSARLSLLLGVDASGSIARSRREGSLSVPRREGSPYPFGTPPGSALASDDAKSHVLGVAVLAGSELAAWSGFTASPALRFEPSLIEAQRNRPRVAGFPDTGRSQLQAAVEPRLSVEQRLPGSVRLFGAVGRYHQPPAANDLSAVFGNPALGLESATHLVVGESVSLASRTRVEAQCFAKWLDGLATPNVSDAPALGQVLVPTGQGRVWGSQLFVRQAEVHGLSGWLSATLSRSERRDADGAWRLSDYDSPLVLAASAVQRWGAWRFGARARFATGAPRTPVVRAYFDLGAERYRPELGRTNSVRLRDFFQLDLRVDRRVELGADTTLELYLDLLNVTFQQNQEELAYSSDFRQLGSVQGLPPLASFGLTVQR